MFAASLRSNDFERVLAQLPCARSAHFSAHRLAAVPTPPHKPQPKAAVTGLSTMVQPDVGQAVDDSPTSGDRQEASGPSAVAATTLGPVIDGAGVRLQGHWLGMVVPKRHARRAVTRNLIRRQMRALMQAHASELPPGLWVLRLKAPFDPRQFPSACSQALRTAVRDELGVLLRRARSGQPQPRGPRPPRPGSGASSRADGARAPAPTPAPAVPDTP